MAQYAFSGTKLGFFSFWFAVSLSHEKRTEQIRQIKNVNCRMLTKVNILAKPLSDNILSLQHLTNK